MLVDFHTHQTTPDAKVRKLSNISLSRKIIEAVDQFEFKPELIYSAGIHPWDIEPEFLHESYDWLEIFLKNPQVKVLGECGLDKINGPDFIIQEEVFVKQIRIAEHFRKPLVIHCVRSFNELLAIKKLINPKVPMVIHGFNKNAETATMMIEKGFLLSFGYDLIMNDKLQQVFAGLSLEKVLFETDNMPDLKVYDVYKKAAEIKKIPVEQLTEIIYQNYLELFI
ncbi:MAG: TatD family hydrolase [Bacteroidetes bacterium]|nr:TatD family hydrolase [Bacteroidota bacterium]